MYECFYTDENPDDSYLPSCYGTALTTIKVGTNEHRALMYMPKSARANSVLLTVLPPNGWTCERAFQESNWSHLAEDDEHRDKFAVLFLEPENGGDWNLDCDFGDKNSPGALIHAVLDQILMAFKYINVDGTRFGLLGYGEGGTAAQMAAMEYPTAISCVVSVGAPNVDPKFAKQAGDAVCDELCFYTVSGKAKGILNREIPVPCWIVDDPEYCTQSSLPALDYWRDTVGAYAKPIKVAPDTDGYYRDKPTPHPLNQDFGAYCVWHSTFPGAVRQLGRTYNRRFWRDFLWVISRYPGDPEGSMHVHKDPVRDCGAEYHYQRIDGWMREWFTYVPKSVRDNPDRPVPLVVAIHGYGCSGEYYFNDAQWYKVADERGFIVVCPSGVNGGKYKLIHCDTPVMAPSWNQVAAPNLPDECVFFRELVEITCREHNIDRSRIYATGHSNGSTTSHLLGLALPDVFAAIGCIGGAIPGIFLCVLDRADVINRPNLKVPAWIFIGQEEADMLPAFPKEGDITANTINMWLKIDGIEPVTGDGWTHGWVGNGRYQDLVYSDGKRPMVRFSNVQDMPHAATTEISYRLWDEFFRFFSRGEDGEPKYERF